MTPKIGTYSLIPSSHPVSANRSRDMKIFARNTLATHISDLDAFKQEDCQALCKDTRHCLSYFWAPYAYAHRTVLLPSGRREQSSSDESHAECVLLGETVKGMNDTVYRSPLVSREQVFDLGCEVSYDGVYDYMEGGGRCDGCGR